MVIKSKIMFRQLTNILFYVKILSNRVAKMRKVLQNGMSFANERLFLRYLCASAIINCELSHYNRIGLSNFLVGRFFMSKKLKTLFFSRILESSTETQKITYIAVITALTVVCNIFFEFKLADTQFSLTIFFSALAGMIIGPLFGFVACFLGDLVGFLCNSGGFMYMPWIGLSMGLVAMIAGFIMNGINLKFKGAQYLKIFFVCILTFLVCTVAINTTAFWIIYNTKKVPYFAYLITRLLVQGQIYNSLFNYGLLFALYPVIERLIKTLNARKNNSDEEEDISLSIEEEIKED